jgi:hypothetical protein
MSIDLFGYSTQTFPKQWLAENNRDGSLVVTERKLEDMGHAGDPKWSLKS